MCRRFWLRGPKGSLCTPRDRDGGKGSLSRRDVVAKLPIWGLTCGYFRDLWTEKSKLASMLVIWSPRGPRVPMAWGGCVGAAGYPMGCQIGRRRGTKRHWRDLRRPLKFPNLIVSLTRFGHVPEGYLGPSGSICRNTRRLVIEIRQIWGLVSPPGPVPSGVARPHHPADKRPDPK